MPESGLLREGVPGTGCFHPCNSELSGVSAWTIMLGQHTHPPTGRHIVRYRSHRTIVYSGMGLDHSSPKTTGGCIPGVWFLESRGEVTHASSNQWYWLSFVPPGDASFPALKPVVPILHNPQVLAVCMGLYVSQALMTAARDHGLFHHGAPVPDPSFNKARRTHPTAAAEFCPKPSALANLPALSCLFFKRRCPLEDVS
jgi:hypothetical protein